ncbi:acyl-homoserine-lactone synthase [Emcibacter nanhaiensis]|uniref:Acyl-homoserine-lactone synthase n=1 Tax=Emcibacter nanhaiensis TaxID=1505037 RepID=A0A501PF23_9PROT|nr:acyl-homoserine-lactone synthase [Emcibacter nanhaiensis]TPD59020.1 GNAT family N-acetyltransferase [Emcibacter nanhaiensis]
MHVDMVTHENRHHFSDELRLMFRQRFDVFEEQMGWQLPMADYENRLEIDEFDSEDTVYLLIKDDNNELIGSLRLLPSTGPHLMSELFSHLVEGPVARADDTWECSRVYVLSNKGKASGLKAGGGAELSVAMMEAGLMLGISKINVIANMNTLPMILRSGWGTMPLGLPQTVGNEQVIALSIMINPVGLQVLRQRRNVPQSMLRILQKEKEVA